MKFRINYNGDYKDSIIVTGETIEEIKEKTFYEVDKRGWEKENCWSQQLVTLKGSALQ